MFPNLRSLASKLRAPFAVAFLVGAAGTACVDPQTELLSEDLPLANPAPPRFRRLEIQAKHRILIGEIDTGVDYNHPFLRDALHFKLDAKGEPLGLGYDFLGGDPWPAPYLIRTSVYAGNEGTEDHLTGLRGKHVLQRIRAYLAPDLQPLLDPRRNIQQELGDDAYHGTHVAGLLTYDRTDLGLIPYRVLPVATNVTSPQAAMQEVADHVLEAIRMADRDGVKVVNLSLGLAFQRAQRALDRPSEVLRYEERAELVRQLRAELLKHPHMLFVAAAGNDGSWVDGDERFSLPCGLGIPNILCVGALREDGTAAPFTNFSLDSREMIFAVGTQLLSTYPTRMCADRDQLGVLNQLPPAPTEADFVEAARRLSGACSSGSYLARASGTSMAAPMVARAAAILWLERPKLTAIELIAVLRQQARPGFLGSIPILRLKVQRPSWYGGEILGPARAVETVP